MMSAVTTLVISFTLVSLNIGFSERFLPIWLRSWGIAFIIATFSILFVGPQVQRLVHRLFRGLD